MSEQSLNQSLEDEISLKDIIDFLVESWKAILATGVLGVLAAGTYIVVTPNKYEATALIQMAKNANSNPLESNIEEPDVLIVRMKFPSSYDQAAISACGYEGKPNAAESLASMTKFSVSKKTQLVNLTVNGLSREQAIQCADSILRLIKESQKTIGEPLINEAKVKLVKYSQRLQDAQSFMAKAQKLDLSISATYLFTRDEVRYLNDKIAQLNDFINSALIRETKLVTPIYSPDNKVSPRSTISLIAGLACGLFLGLVLMMGLRFYNSFKALSR